MRIIAENCTKHVRALAFTPEGITAEKAREKAASLVQTAPDEPACDESQRRELREIEKTYRHN